MLVVYREDGRPRGARRTCGVWTTRSSAARSCPGDRLRARGHARARRSRLARAHARRLHRRRDRGGGGAGAGPASGRGARAPARCARRARRRSSIPSAQIGAGTVIGPHAVIGEHVRIGRNCRIGASTVIDGDTEIGDGNEIFPFASVGLIPQDLKFRGEPTRLVIGHRNVIREFVTIHRGTAGGGGLTEVGDHNVFMAYAHVAHDCHVRNHTIFGNAATLGGHVTVEDYATISAFSGVHQFCRVGQARLHRRVLGRHQGCAAVREDGRQPRAHLRSEHHRPGASRLLAGRGRQAAARLPLSAALEYQPRDRADRARSFAPHRRSRAISSISSARRAAASAFAARAVASRKWSKSRHAVPGRAALGH